jgi:hypothetical protein
MRSQDTRLTKGIETQVQSCVNDRLAPALKQMQTIEMMEKKMTDIVERQAAEMAAELARLEEKVETKPQESDLSAKQTLADVAKIDAIVRDWTAGMDEKLNVRD